MACLDMLYTYLTGNCFGESEQTHMGKDVVVLDERPGKLPFLWEMEGYESLREATRCLRAGLGLDEDIEINPRIVNNTPQYACSLSPREFIRRRGVLLITLPKSPGAE